VRAVDRQLQREQADAATLAEVETLTKALEVPLTDAVALLTDNHEGYVPPPALELVAQGAGAPATPIEGALFTKGIVNTYITAVLKL
jgi:hypothetical protein